LFFCLSSALISVHLRLVLFVRSDTDPIRELASFHNEFAKPEAVYFAGNSLGLMPRGAELAVAKLIQEWKQYGVEGWADCGWLDQAERLSPALALLIGAHPDEVIVTGTTTVNLHQLLATFYQPRANKRKILIDGHAFPSDRYAVASHLRLRGGDPVADLMVVSPRNGQIFSPGELAERFSTDVAIAVLPSVIFTTGQLMPLAELVEAAEQKEIVLILDCSHSIGSVPHDFHRDRVPLAFWCSYKYLNGGPGAVGGLFCQRQRFASAPGLAGWWGNDPGTRFDMMFELQPAGTASSFHISTPNLLSLVPLGASLEIFQRATISKIRSASLKLTDRFMQRARDVLPEFEIVTPSEPDQRGGQVTLRHAEGRRISAVLRRRHRIIGDFRAPDLLRFAPVALYNSAEEVDLAVAALRETMDRRDYLEISNTKESVT
jgi:kynureninase